MTIYIGDNYGEQVQAPNLMMAIHAWQTLQVLIGETRTRDFEGLIIKTKSFQKIKMLKQYDQRI